MKMLLTFIMLGWTYFFCFFTEKANFFLFLDFFYTLWLPIQCLCLAVLLKLNVLRWFICCFILITQHFTVLKKNWRNDVFEKRVAYIVCICCIGLCGNTRFPYGEVKKDKISLKKNSGTQQVHGSPNQEISWLQRNQRESEKNNIISQEW